MNAQSGFSLVEMMVGVTLGMIISLAVVGVYFAQISSYKTHNAQSGIQDAQNAIAALLLPIIQGAGFAGCSSVMQANSNLNAGGPPPIGTLNTTPAFIAGYDAAVGTTINITQNNAANSSNSNSWLPALHTSLTGSVQAVSDVLMVLGTREGGSPISITSATSGNTAITLQNTTGVVRGQFGAISDCMKATIFAITNVSGNSISYAQGSGALRNIASTLNVNYNIGSQFIPITQTAFFIANDISGHSALVKATLTTNGTWTIQSFIPNINTMQVLYGIGTNGSLARYVPANLVTNWSQVYAIRLGFLISTTQSSNTKTTTTHSLLGNTISVPSDNRLRHAFEMTIHLRNAS